MVPKRRREAITRLDKDEILRRRCAVCGQPAPITHVDFDTAMGIGECCVHELKQADNLLLAIGKSIGWDIFSTWENPRLNRREQAAIKYRAHKPFKLD